MIKYKRIDMSNYLGCQKNIPICKNCDEKIPYFDEPDVITVLDFRSSKNIYCSTFFSKLLKIRDKVVIVVSKGTPIYETLKILKIDSVIKMIVSPEDNVVI